MPEDNTSNALYQWKDGHYLQKLATKRILRYDVCSMISISFQRKHRPKTQSIEI